MVQHWKSTDLLGSVPARFYMVLADFTNLRDSYLEGHSQRVAEFATELARRAGGFNNDKLRLLYAAGLIHDVGKIGIPDSIITKSGELNPAERKMINDHPLVGHEIISRYVDDHIILDAILHHHENMDGTGYPHGHGDGKITLAARVIRIVDSYDAMTTRRPYRMQLTTGQAVVDLQQHHEWYDMRLLKIFIEMVQPRGGG